MGVSTDGILFFGYCWNNEGWPSSDEDEIIEEPEPSPEEVYLVRKGLWHPLPHRKAPSKEYDAWSNNLAVRRELEQQLPFELFTHCHHECPMWAMAIRGTKTTAWRGGPKEIDMSSLAVTYNVTSVDAQQKYDAILREACEVLGMKPGKLGWWLVSNWA